MDVGYSLLVVGLKNGTGRLAVTCPDNSNVEVELSPEDISKLLDALAAMHAANITRTDTQ